MVKTLDERGTVGAKISTLTPVPATAAPLRLVRWMACEFEGVDVEMACDAMWFARLARSGLAVRIRWIISQ